MNATNINTDGNDANHQKVMFIGRMHNAYMIAVSRISDNLFSFTFELPKDDLFITPDGHEYDRIKAVGDLDGRHLKTISVYNDGSDVPDGVFIYERRKTPPVPGHQRIPGIDVWLREHGYNIASKLPRLCFELTPPVF